MFGVDDALMAVGAGALNLGAAWQANRWNRQNASDARNWDASMYSHRYQMQVADLKAAGLNPALAYGQSPGSAPAGPSAAAADKPDIAGGILAARANSAQVANINADTIKKGAEASNINADTLVKGGMLQEIAAMTAQALSSAAQSQAMRDQIRATMPKIDAEIDNLKSLTEKNKTDVKYSQALIHAQEIKNSLVQAQTVLENNKATLEAQNIARGKPGADVYENMSPAKKEMFGKGEVAGDYMQNVIRLINPFSRR